MTRKIIKTVDLVSTSIADERICVLDGPICGDGDGLLSGAIRFNGTHWYPISTRNAVDFPVYIAQRAYRYLNLLIDSSGSPFVRIFSEGDVPSQRLEFNLRWIEAQAIIEAHGMITPAETEVMLAIALQKELPKA